MIITRIDHLPPLANPQDDTLVADDHSFRKVVLQLFSLEDGDHVDEDFVDGAGDDFDPMMTVGDEAKEKV